MTYTVFNRKKIDFTKQPMFFGENLNVQRFDEFKYKIFNKLNDTMQGFFWRPEEVSLQKDRNDYKQLSENEKFIFTSNLKYQILLDSVQGRGPMMAFLPYVSIPELEACIITWDFFESIHSRSYTYIINNLYAEPAKVFDTIVEDKEIVKRATSVSKHYDDFINYARKLETKDSITKDEKYQMYKKFYLSLISVNLLEGMRFYVSFACSFAFGENKLMEGSAKILSLIARDENLHLALTQHIINLYRKEEGDKLMLQVMKDSEEEVYQMYRDSVDEEKAWATYLFKNGSMIGINDKLVFDYIEYLANRRLRAIGLDKIYDVPLNQNPLPWMSNWLASKNVQIAPQETEVESYIIGGIKKDLDIDKLNDIEL